MKPIRTIVVDDEPLARENLLLRLQDVSDCEVVAECAGGREALEAVFQHQPDLLFIDIQMPDLDGFEVVGCIPASRMPVIVFVTAFDQYALDAFQAHALDYLLKPFSTERFHSAWMRARDQVLRLRQDDDHAHPLRERLLIRSGGRMSFVKIGDIDWVESSGDYARIHSGDRSYLLRRTMGDLADQLGGRGFLRISRSAIVNLDRVQQMVPLKRGEMNVELNSGVQLKLTRSYRSQLETFMSDRV